MFEGTGVNITTAGKKQLGAAVGSLQFKEVFVGEKVEEWVSQIEVLSKIAAFDPHSAYTAFTSCLRHRYSYIMRTVPDLASVLAPLEKAIRYNLIPALTEGREVTEMERNLLSLPVKMGGLGLINPTTF